MKKFILVLGLLVLLANGALASDACKYYDCSPAYDMNKKFRAVTSVATGTNFVTEKYVQKAIKKFILKEGIATNVNVKVKSASAKDLKEGRLKSFHFDGDEILVNDIHLSHVSLDTICDFNYVKYNGENINFVEELPLSLEMQISAKDLNDTMKHPQYIALIDNVNKLTTVSGFGFKISSTKVAIRSDKFYFVLGIRVPFVANEMRITLESDLKLRNGKIDLSNTRIVSNKFNLKLDNLDLIVNYLNPLDFSVNIFGDKDAHVTLMNSKIQDNKVYASGYVVIPKDNDVGEENE